jgi:hypothetical protein
VFRAAVAAGHDAEDTIVTHMKLNQRQASAINQIIMEEVQGALKGRSEVAGHLRRAQLFESIGEGELYEMSTKVLDISEELSTVASVLKNDRTFSRLADKASEAVLALSTALEENLNGGDIDETAEVDESYGDDDLDEEDDFELPPMHPRAHAERPSSGKKAPPARVSKVPSIDHEPPRGYGHDDSDVKLPPRHPRAR